MSKYHVSSSDQADNALREVMQEIGGSRLFLRSYIYTYTKKRASKLPVAVYGAGSAGAELVKALQSAWEYEPVAFLDDDAEKRSMR